MNGLQKYQKKIPRNDDRIHRYILPRTTAFPQYDTAQFDTIKYDLIQFICLILSIYTIQNNLIRFDTIQFDMIRYVLM